MVRLIFWAKNLIILGGKLALWVLVVFPPLVMHRVVLLVATIFCRIKRRPTTVTGL